MPRTLLPKIDESEKKRLQTLMRYERKARKDGYQLIAGIDEAGRGPLAGPVVAAACIIPLRTVIPFVNDSKQLTHKKRAEIFDYIVNHKKIIWSVGIISHEMIDEVNIYQATILAMKQAVEKLPQKPDMMLVDGLKLCYEEIACEKIIKGDAKSHSIAAASIIAKETRDRIMNEYHAQWPEYGFDSHKGYGTEQHHRALDRFGPCPIHRKSFEPIRKLLGLEIVMDELDELEEQD